MELRHLRYFVAIAEREHFRRAAEQLLVAQPALTRYMKLLEQELGVALFERLPRGVRLTEEGRAFLPDAKRILADVERITERVRRLARGQAGTLHVSFSEAGGWRGVIPDSIVAFRAAQPDVELVLDPLSTAEQILGLREGRIDAAFLYELKTDELGIEHRPVQYDRVVLALPEKHPLAAKRVIRLQDLAQEAFVLTNRALNPQFDDDLLSACIRGGLMPRVVQVVSTSAIVLSLVAVGIGLGLIPSAMRWRLQEGVILRAVKGLEVPYTIEIAWRRDNPSPVLKKFIDLALTIARNTDKSANRAMR